MEAGGGVVGVREDRGGPGGAGEGVKGSRKTGGVVGKGQETLKWALKGEMEMLEGELEIAEGGARGSRSGSWR